MMNKNKQKIRLYEGIGSVCLVGFFASFISNLSSLFSYRALRSMALTPLSKISSCLDQHLQISSEIYPKDSDPCVYYSKIESQEAFLGLPNSKEEKFFNEFYLDEGKTIAVIPRPGTIFIPYKEESTVKTSWRTIIYALATLPLTILRFFTGFNLNTSQKITTSSLKASQSVFIHGFCSKAFGKIEISPEFISSSKQELLSVLHGKMLKSLLIPMIFLLGTLFCYFKVKKIEEESKHKVKIVASPDMKCKKCLISEASLILGPCNHFVLCSECLATHCPVCNTLIVNRTKIYRG